MSFGLDLGLGIGTLSSGVPVPVGYFVLSNKDGTVRLTNSTGGVILLGKDR